MASRYKPHARGAKAGQGPYEKDKDYSWVELYVFDDRGRLLLYKQPVFLNGAHQLWGHVHMKHDRKYAQSQIVALLVLSFSKWHTIWIRDVFCSQYQQVPGVPTKTRLQTPSVLGVPTKTRLQNKSSHTPFNV